jgi:hypothetical protein
MAVWVEPGIGTRQADAIGHFVRGPAEDAVVLPGGLVRRIVRQLVLVHHGAAVLAVPDDIVLTAD